MDINLNELLIALSYTLDFVEMDVLGVTSNHSKRVAYISNRIALELSLDEEERSDLAACAILHDNGVTKYMLEMVADIEGDKKYVLENIEEHCEIGQVNVESYPFFTGADNVIKYHHEAYDGSGFFGLRGEEIPIMAQIIAFADSIDITYDLKKITYDKIRRCRNYVNDNRNARFSPELVDAFNKLSKQPNFWLELNDNMINSVLYESLPGLIRQISWQELEKITEIFSKIIDNKSEFTLKHSQGLSEKVEKLARYYDKGEDEVSKLKIAANLHDIGKLGISNNIIDKPFKLDTAEIYEIRQHTYFSRISLSQVKVFNEITEWACNHHEKLDGTGYPFGLGEENLDFNSRLVMCLDIYQALREERPYRKGLSHKKSMLILNNMVDAGAIDRKIVIDIDKVFG